MGKFIKDWWQEFVLILLGAVMFVLGVKLDAVNNLTPGSVGSILAAVISFTAAVISFGNKIEIHKQLGDLQKYLDERLRGVGAQIRLFENKEEFLIDKAKRVALVRKEILDTGFNYHLSQSEQSSEPSTYQSEYGKQLERKIHDENITFRKIVYINTQEQLDYIVAKLERDKGYKYYLGCYVGLPENVPFLEFMIFDGEEAYIGGYRGRDWSLGEFNVFVRDPAVVKVLTDYHKLLWEKSIKLNGGRGDEIYYDHVGEIKKQLEPLTVQGNQVLGEREAVYKRLLDGLANAKYDINVVSFHQLVTEDEHRLTYYQEVETAIQRPVMHRRIIWNKNHVRWIRNWLEKFKDSRYLEVRFYDEEEPTHPRIEVTFDLIDGEKVIFLQGLIPPFIVESVDPAIARLMSNYFEQLWGLSGSMVLKDYHSGVNWKLLEQLELRFGLRE